MQISVFLVVITVLIIFFAEKIGFQCNNSLITATNNTRFVFFTTKNSLFPGQSAHPFAQ